MNIFGDILNYYNNSAQGKGHPNHPTWNNDTMLGKTDSRIF